MLGLERYVGGKIEIRGPDEDQVVRGDIASIREGEGELIEADFTNVRQARWEKVPRDLSLAAIYTEATNVGGKQDGFYFNTVAGQQIILTKQDRAQHQR